MIDWYDNEHIPLRLEQCVQTGRSATQSRSLPEFLTAVRYQATDGKKPHWSAGYEISDPLLFEQAKYTKLRANRSQREADLVGRLETLDRRTYTSVLYDSAGNEPPRGAERASPIVVTITSDDQPVDLEKWNDLSGWRRTTAYKLGDSLKISHGKAPETTSVARYLTVNEFDHPRDFEHSEQYRHAKEHAKEVRTWKVHRAFDNTATR